MPTNKPNVINRDTPLITARMFQAQCRVNMFKYQNDWLDYNGSAYVMVEDETILSEVLLWLEECKRSAAYDELDPVTGLPTGKSKFKLEPFYPKEADVQQVAKLLAHAFLVEPGAMKPPFFLDGGTGDHAGLNPANLISCQNGLLDITTRTLYPATPQFFTRTALPIEYDPDATCPLFLKFLFQVLDDDELVALMRQWFGYLITTDMSLEMLLYLQGVPRSGKSTIGIVLDALIGPDNVASHMLHDIATNFDRESMLGKSALKVSEVDASDKVVLNKSVAIFNQIVGVDRTHIQRKFKGSLDADLRMHVVLIGNECPDFGAHAVAFGERACVIPFLKTIPLEERDTGLKDKLRAELPGILNFALEGLADLRAAGKFNIVAASEEAKGKILNSGSPVRAFVGGLCELSDERGLDKTELFQAFDQYRISIRAFQMSEPVFFKKLHEAFPQLQNKRMGSDGERENWITGIYLRDTTTITMTFWLDPFAVDLGYTGFNATLRDPITNEPYGPIRNEFPNDGSEWWPT